MLDDLLALFAIVPDYDLDVMRHDQTLTQITTRVLEGMEPVLAAARPDVVLVHGDTSTSTAAARWPRSTRGSRSVTSRRGCARRRSGSRFPRR
jgi:UDP-N-acetylglucosamine 2-epimerase